MEPARMDVPTPAERAIYQPMGFGVDREEESCEVAFLIHPMKMVIIQLTDEQRGLLVQELSGGIIPAPRPTLIRP